MTQRKPHRYALSGVRTCLLFLAFCLTSGLAGVSMRQSSFKRYVIGFWNEGGYARANAIYALLIFFSLAGVFCLHHTDLKRDYAERPEGLSGGRFILTSRFFWIDIAVTALFCAIAPAVSPFSDLALGFLPNHPAASGVWLSKLIAFPFIAAVQLAAYASTVSWWSRQRELFSSKGRVAPFIKFALQLVLTAVAWVAVGEAVTLAVPMLATVIAILGAAKLPILAALIVLLVLWGVLLGLRYLGAIRERRVCIRTLARLCREQGFTLLLTGHPCRAVIRPDEGSHLLLQKGDFKLACRFVSAPSKGVPLYLNEDGTATYVKERLLFKHHVSERYAFDADGDTQKLLIVCPCRSEVFVKGPHGERPLESGDPLMEYRMYSASGLLNAMNRGLLTPKR